MYDGSGYKSYHSGSLFVGDESDTTYKLKVAGRSHFTDTLRVPRIVGGVLATDNLTLRNFSGSLSPVGIDSNGLKLGTATGIAGTLLNINKVYASPTTNVTAMRVVPQVYETLTTHSSGLIAGLFQPVITGANNKSWGAGAIQGVSVAPTISSGATGTIPNIYGITITKTFNAAAAIIDTLVYERAYPSTESAPSVVNNVIYNLVGVGQGIGGHWSRYDATTYNSYWGTGNQLINTNIDGGFGEKLQVAGRVDASRATRGSNLVTKDQLDSTATAGFSNFIQNQQAIAQTGNFNITGNGIANRFLAAAGTAGGAMTHYTMATTGFVNRFTLDLTGSESGSNSGSNWQLNRWSDAGSSLGAALFVRRSDGFIGVNTSTPNYRFTVGAGVMYGDGIGTSIVTKNTNNTASITNETVLNCTASITQTLPDAISGNYGKIFVINKDYDGGSVTVASNSIDGSLTYTLTDTVRSITVISSGVSWRIISTKIGPAGYRRTAPTLNDVTTAGNVTANDIQVNNIYSTGNVRVGEAFSTKIAAISTDVTLDDTYTTVWAATASSPRTLTLPATSDALERMYFIKRSSQANTLTLNTTGGDAFEDFTTSMTVPNAVIVQRHGSLWLVLAKY
jgi:hypothetical protein